MKILQLIAIETETFWQKLFRKNGRILAEVCVENGQIKVESRYPEVKKELLDFIKVMEEKKLHYGYHRHRMEGDSRITEFTHRKITDPDFLDAFSDTLSMTHNEPGPLRSFDWRPRYIEK